MSAPALDQEPAIRPTALPTRQVRPRGEIDRAPGSVGPRSAAYRVVYRLTGSARRASTVADEAAAAAATSKRATVGPEAIATAVGVAVEAVLSTAESVLSADHGRDPFTQHRTRLRRELARWRREERVALALRHLVRLSPEQVALILVWEEAAVRDITRRWDANDATMHAVIDLRQYEQMFAQVRSTEAPAPASLDALEHLDRPLP